MNNGWDRSASSWIASMGERGDWGREFVLDAPMRAEALLGAPRTALDIGCGEGRFCRMLKDAGVAAIGVDPTLALIDEARARSFGRLPLGPRRSARLSGRLV
ncbi:MAG: class I SAM-dependent methyltransferase [Parvularculaceae bacterium]|nr:class I SAM-dependent methyltransferase [Parvularculaceae bacterium]